MEINLPKEISRGEFTLFGVTVTVVNLDNGQRVIEGDGVARLLDGMSKSGQIDEGELTRFAAMVKGSQ